MLTPAYRAATYPTTGLLGRRPPTHHLCKNHAKPIAVAFELAETSAFASDGTSSATTPPMRPRPRTRRSGMRGIGLAAEIRATNHPKKMNPAPNATTDAGTKGPFGMLEEPLWATAITTMATQPTNASASMITGNDAATTSVRTSRLDVLIGAWR